MLGSLLPLNLVVHTFGARLPHLEEATGDWYNQRSEAAKPPHAPRQPSPKNQVKVACPMQQRWCEIRDATSLRYSRQAMPIPGIVGCSR